MMDVIPESLQEIADGLGHAGGVFDKMISLLDSDETKPARELVNQIDRVRFLTAQLRQQVTLAAAKAQQLVSEVGE